LHLDNTAAYFSNAIRSVAKEAPMYRAEQRQQIYAIFLQFTKKQAHQPPRRSAWMRAFSMGLADLGSQRVMPGAQPRPSSRSAEKL
jgi:hypothetical protein